MVQEVGREESDYIRVKLADQSRHIVLGRLPIAVPEFKKLHFSPEIKIQGGRGQGGVGSERFIFINGSDTDGSKNLLTSLQKILDDLGSLNLAGLPNEDIDDLIRLATRDDFQDQSRLDPMV